MKHLITLLILVSLSTVVLAQSEAKIKEVIAESKTAKQAFLEKDDSMQKLFDSSYGYVIFPNVGKGGLVVGGAGGNGVTFEEGKMIGMAKLTQVTVGFQAGGQSYREIIFFKHKSGLDRFKNNKYEFSAQVSAVAVAAGASADAKYVEGVLVITMAKGGLMYEATVGGQKFKFEAF